MPRLLVAVGLASALVAALALAVAHGQDDPATAAGRDAAAALATDQTAQRNLDAWEDERRILQARDAELRHEVAVLERRTRREEAAVAALTGQAAELRRRLVEAERLAESLEDTLAVSLDRLEAVVDRDLPFLPDERIARLASLRAELDHPDTPVAEQLRRLLEAYQVEASYGGTVELVTDAITVDGRELHAEILRVGRLVLFWRTPDGGRSGMWDPAAGAWIDLPGTHHRAVAQAMEMAARRRPVRVIGLPIGRIGGVEP
jgi:predicted RNase H-like nuclease (RuvC/YqgF family)